MMENLTPLFIALTGVAVVLQAGLLAGIYFSMRKTSSRLERLAEEVKSKALPAIDSTQMILTEIRPKLQTISNNLMEISTKVRSQVQRVDATVNDVVDRARLQVIRTDEMVTRTLDRVESASEAVTKTVVSPVRHVSGFIHGISAGVEFLLANRGRKNGGSRDVRRPVPQDEMFI
jgi:methyl-accepting chemotaxis protein